MGLKTGRCRTLQYRNRLYKMLWAHGWWTTCEGHFFMGTMFGKRMKGRRILLRWTLRKEKNWGRACRIQCTQNLAHAKDHLGLQYRMKQKNTNTRARTRVCTLVWMYVLVVKYNYAQIYHTISRISLVIKLVVQLEQVLLQLELDAGVLVVRSESLPMSERGWGGE